MKEIRARVSVFPKTEFWIIPAEKLVKSLKNDTKFNFQPAVISAQISRESSIITFVLTNINECSANTRNCHSEAKCINTEGSFACTCEQCFTVDGDGQFQEVLFNLK